MTAADILRQIASGYTEGVLAFGHGHGAQLNEYKGKDPILWLLENQSMARVRRLSQGLYRLEGNFLILKPTRDTRKQTTTATQQASNEDQVAACDECDRISRQLAYVCQYFSPQLLGAFGQIGYTNFQWSSQRVQMQGAGLLSGVMVAVGFNYRAAEELTDFLKPAPVPPAPQTLAAPEFETQPGTYEAFVTVLLRPRTDGALEYFTTDGTIPTPQTGTLYTDGIALNQSRNVLVRAFKNGFNSSQVLQGQFTINGLTISLSQAGGVFPIDSPPTVLPIVNSIGALAYLTTDGSDPDQSDPLFNAPFVPTQNVTLSARAFQSPAAPSNIARQTYQLKLNAPTVNAGGTFTTERIVSATPAAVGVNQYRINSGAWVTGDSVLLTSSASVTFRTISPNHVTSDEVTRVITIQVADVTASLAGGTYEGAISVTLSTTTPGAEIRFTLDGSEPTQSSTLAIGAIPIGNSSTLRYRAFKAGRNPSNIGQQVYVINVRLYIATTPGTDLMLSRDLGLTWNAIPSPYALSLGMNRNFESIMSVGGGLIAGFDGISPLRRSLNLGQSWQQVAPFQVDSSYIYVRGTDIMFMRNSSGLPAGESRLYLSTDSGNTATRLDIDAVNIGSNIVTSFCKNGNTIMASRSVSGNATIWISTDNGATWNIRLSSNFRPTVQRWSFISLDSQFLFQVLGGGYAWSTNGGLSFNLGSLGLSVEDYAFCIDQPLTIFYMTQSAGATAIRRVTNGQPVNNTPIITIPSFLGQFMAANQDGSRLLVSGQGRTFLVTLSPTPVATEITANLPTIASGNAFNFQMV